MRLTALALILAVAGTLPAADWPQWRGPNRDGTVPAEPAWPAALTDKSLMQVWQVKGLGPSYSGPVAADGKVFTTETVDAKTEVASAYDRVTGKRLWRTQWAGSITVPFFAAKNGSWIRATPAYFDGKLYVAGMRDVLVCLDAATGDQVWRYDFPKELGSPPPAFGMVCSPLADESGVTVQAGASLVKLDRATGKLLWRTLTDEGGMNGSAFSSPVFAKLNGTEQLVVQTRTKLAGVNPATGKVLWEQPVASMRGMNILTPQPVGTDAVFTSTYGGTSQLLKLTGPAGGVTARPAWAVKYEGYMTSPVVIGGYAYLLGRDQRFVCFDLKAGKEAWRTEKRFGAYWSLVAQGDRILALDETGTLRLIRANPKEYDPLGEVKAAEAASWAHLAVSGADFVVRDASSLTLFRWAAR
jgi:outer membrane protein assembly factor BamB